MTKPQVFCQNFINIRFLRLVPALMLALMLASFFCAPSALAETDKVESADRWAGSALEETPSTPNPPAASPYYSSKTIVGAQGTLFDETIINGPPQPPAGFELQRAQAAVMDASQPEASLTLTVPAYDWVLGCSAVSSAMVAAYYDRNGYASIYSGPANGGVMPLNSSIWPTWSDGTNTFPGNPLVASRNGLDGRTTRGTIDDYWVRYGSSAQDPFLTKGWTEHTWGSAIGDFMKTSQWLHYNMDGETAFYSYSTSSMALTCRTMELEGIASEDGTYGRKLFYEARGYTVSDCYNQNTDNAGGGFTYARYVAEINAGHPVLINLAGHSVVGVGYNQSGNQVYIHDTWDYGTYAMTWGGAYVGMPMQSVSIVHISGANPPGAFGKLAPLDGGEVTTASLTLTWASSANATGYEFCYDTSDDDLCSVWTSTGTATSAALSGLNPDKSYFWHVRAKNGFGTTYSDGSSAAFRSFTTGDLPGAFNKSAPDSGSKWQLDNPQLSWTGSLNASGYEYCYDTNDNDQCDSSWHGSGDDPGFLASGSATAALLIELESETQYFWQVRATNDFGAVEADAGDWWSFTTGEITHYSAFLPTISKSP